MEFMSDPFAIQSEFQILFIREPFDSGVPTDICPTVSAFMTSRDNLDQKISRYEKLLAFEDWLMAELTNECQIYDIFLRNIQNPEVVSLQDSFDTTRTEKVLRPLDPAITTYQDVVDLYQSLTSTGMREAFVSEYVVG